MSPISPSGWTAASVPPAPGPSPHWAAGTTSGSSPLLPDAHGSLGRAWLVLEAAWKMMPSGEHLPEPPARPKLVPSEAGLSRPAWIQPADSNIAVTFYLLVPSLHSTRP